MRVAVLSDIHANYHAFKACYDDAVRDGVDSFIFLGDYISDLAEPQKTMDLVYEIQANYPTICLRGNRERYMLDCEKGSSFHRGSKSGSLRLYVKASRKRQGIGTRLLHTVELYLQKQGKTAAHVHLGGKEYFESHSFYPKHGYTEYAPNMMKKEL